MSRTVFSGDCQDNTVGKGHATKPGWNQMLKFEHFGNDSIPEHRARSILWIQPDIAPKPDQKRVIFHSFLFWKTLFREN